MRAVPKRLIVVVEGQTERNFVDRVLRPHLQHFGITVSATVVGKAKAADRGQSGPGARGGNRYADWRRDIRNQNTAARRERLEQALQNDIDDRRFKPYIQRHEFEALVLAAKDCLADLYDAEDQLSGLARLQAEIAGMAPEEINDSPKTAPSKRLLRQIPGYCKAEDGPDAIELAGLSSVRDQCPRFDAWLTGLQVWGTFE